MTINMFGGCDIPKRGDLITTNSGDRKQRTWFVLAIHKLKPTKNVPRCRVWIERWWEVEPELRVRLWKSAERNGGQAEIAVVRDKPKPKKRKTFEQIMKGQNDTSY